MKRILKYLKPYRKKVVIAVLLVSVSSICDLLLPTLMSSILDNGVRGKDFGYICLCCLAMLVTAGLSLATVLWSNKLAARLVADVSCDMRADIFRKVNTFTFEEFGKLGTAALVTRATHDVETLSWIVSMLASTVATMPLLFIGGFVLALLKDVVLSLIILAFLPIIVIAVILIGKKVLPLWENSDLYIDKQNAIMRERLRGIRVIRAFGSEAHEHERIAEATNVMAESIIRGNTAMGILTPMAMLLLNVAIVLIVYLSGLRFGSGLSAGDVFAIVQYVTMVMNGVIMASFAIVMLPRAQVASKRIGEVLDAKGMGQNEHGIEHTLEGNIRFENVSFSYGGANKAVSNICLNIEKGQKVAIIGGTGSGKSTLVSLMLGFRMPTEGKVLYDGIATTDLAMSCVRDGISSVLQGSAIYTGTIAENIRMGRPDATDEELYEAARIAQLSDFVDTLDGKLEYEITQAGKNLSGGQKQRLSIARAIVKEAPIYIFDDSFSALDFLTEKKLRSALNEHIRGKTQIVITQRITSAMSADCIFVMEKGELIDAGKHDELLERCKVYREIFASQTGGGTK
ncbi:MAG: ABC transporter ATP-binding protein [Ruminococcaceae bacterium]|nr:ABC transporter ATP-binding protein [Oscillospiraceae bacterium]